tara:strand:+ start:1372 stop:2820 length:1449 start_codon:yes stop_codon:yes gene_type:complete
MKNNNQNWNIENSYSKLPSKFYSKQLPEKVINPKKIYFNSNLALDIGLESLSEIEILDYFSGNKIPKAAMPIAQAYAGHQFGHFTTLGDGRAILLGEQISPKNIRYDIQLKGSGKTPYSRRGDGRATLSSMLREYIISEAMHYLGIPTTRSLAIIQTGEKVYRDQIYDGGILTRVSSSHIRFGTFEFARKFCSKDDLEIFIKYVIDRHYPEISNADNSAIRLFELVMIKQIDLIINWMRVGFIHGVMNTDNMSISGETIDYGPCAFMNAYNPDTVFSSIDKSGRYSFGNQPNIMHWNLAIFANTLLPIISDNENKSIELIKEKLNKFSSIFSNNWYSMMYKKLGILEPIEKDKILVESLLELMKNYKADYTNTFAALTLNNRSNDSLFISNEFKKWRKKWKDRINFSDNSTKIFKLMHRQNPLVIPRNHLVELALEQSINGNFKYLNDLLDLVSNPYNYKSNYSFQDTPKGFDDSYKTFCGT